MVVIPSLEWEMGLIEGKGEEPRAASRHGKRKGGKLTFAKFSLSYRHKIILEGLSCPHLNDEGAVTQEL